MWVGKMWQSSIIKAKTNTRNNETDYVQLSFFKSYIVMPFNQYWVFKKIDMVKA